MIYPSVDELTKDKYNRYILSVAMAKGARIIAEKEAADDPMVFKDDKGGKRQKGDVKPVKLAINDFYAGKFKIKLPEQN